MARVTDRQIRLLLSAILIGCYWCGAAIPNLEQMLREKILNDSHLDNILPVRHPSDVVNVTFGFELINIVNVNAKEQSITVYGWVTQTWINPLLKWNKSEHGGIDVTHVDPKHVWVPDTLLYNNIDEQDHMGGYRGSYKTNVALHSNGTSSWSSPALFKSICKILVSYFPLDNQTCTLKFGSWAYDSSKLDLFPRTGMVFPTQYYINNGEWSITNVAMKRNVKQYHCCVKPFTDITMTIEMERKSLDYFINLIIPCCLISSMIFLGFILPPESGERIGLSITVLLAMTVFQQLTSEIMPSYDIPLLGQYYFCIILEIGASILVTTVILNFYHRTNRKMPCWIKLVVLNWLACLVFLKKDAQKCKAIRRQKRESRRRGKSFKERRAHPKTYQRNIKNCKNSTEEREESSMNQEYHFNEGMYNGSEVKNTDMQELRHVRQNSYRLNTFASQFSKMNSMDIPDREMSAELGRSDDESAELSDDELILRHWQWTLAAKVLDRIFLLIAIICGIVTVSAIFLSAPKVWKSHPELKNEDPIPIVTDY